MDHSLKDAILDAVDIVDVIGESVTLQRKGKEFVGLCPFHNDRKPSMSINPVKRIFKCFACGAGGDVIRFIQMHRNLEFREALAFLADKAGIEFRSTPTDQRATALREQLLAAMTFARNHFIRNLKKGANGQAAYEYARGRGLTDATIEQFGIGFAPESWDDLGRAAGKAGLDAGILQQAGLCGTNTSGKTYDRFRNRLIFPITDRQGRCVAFGGRALGDDPAKYLNSPETVLFSKGRLLYGMQQARPVIEAERSAVIVEGYLDAILLQQGGVGNVLATLGTALTDAHAKALRPIADTLILCFDADEAGERAADRALEVSLKQKLEVRVALLEGGLDPADYVIRHGGEAFKSLLQSTIAALEFKWTVTEAAYRAQGERGRREAIDRYLRFVATAIGSGALDPVSTSELIARLAGLLQLPHRAILETLDQLRTRVHRGESFRTPDTSQPESAYDESLGSLPAGLVSSMEELFGIVLHEPSRFEMVESSLTAGSQHCRVWQRLVTEMSALLDEKLACSVQAVLARCEDDAVADLVVRARTRVSQPTCSDEFCTRVAQRVTDELGFLRIGSLQAKVRRTGLPADDQARAFESLCRAARQHHGQPSGQAVLPSAHRSRTTYRPGASEEGDTSGHRPV